jgi:hypothetical protein
MALFEDIPLPVWVALFGVVSGIGARFVSESKINASFERARIKTIAEGSKHEAAFRAKMMAEIAAVRSLVKPCEPGREVKCQGARPAVDQRLLPPTADENIAILSRGDRAPPGSTLAQTGGEIDVR